MRCYDILHCKSITYLNPPANNDRMAAALECANVRIIINSKDGPALKVIVDPTLVDAFDCGSFDQVQLINDVCCNFDCRHSRSNSISFGRARRSVLQSTIIYKFDGLGRGKARGMAERIWRSTKSSTSIYYK